MKLKPELPRRSLRFLYRQNKATAIIKPPRQTIIIGTSVCFVNSSTLMPVKFAIHTL
jgi:hypothetical protein